MCLQITNKLAVAEFVRLLIQKHAYLGLEHHFKNASRARFQQFLDQQRRQLDSLAVFSFLSSYSVQMTATQMNRKGSMVTSLLNRTYPNPKYYTGPTCGTVSLT